MSVLPLSDNPTTTPFFPPVIIDAPAKQFANRIEPSANEIMRALLQLQANDLAEQAGRREADYRALVAPYTLGLKLREDAELREAFYAHAVWDTHVGRKPNRKDGAAGTIQAAISIVLGGKTRERNQRASMIGAALSYLAHLEIEPQNLVEELGKPHGASGKTGLKALAALEAKRRRGVKPDQPETVVIKTIKVKATSAVIAELWKLGLYILDENGTATLSSDPDNVVPVLLGGGS